MACKPVKDRPQTMVGKTCATGYGLTYIHLPPYPSAPICTYSKRQWPLSVRSRCSDLLLVVVGGAMATFASRPFSSGSPQGQVLAPGDEIGAVELNVVNDDGKLRNVWSTGEREMTNRSNSVWQEMLKQKVMLGQVEEASTSLTSRSTRHRWAEHPSGVPQPAQLPRCRWPAQPGSSSSTSAAYS